jgi:subtilisin family serine protease
MATPHVSGIAGLLKAFDPALTNLEIKAAILQSVDPLVSLQNKIVAGGRVNAHKALLAVQQKTR